jgi:soluble lytic murein transglycosylase
VQEKINVSGQHRCRRFLLRTAVAALVFSLAGISAGSDNGRGKGVSLPIALRQWPDSGRTSPAAASRSLKQGLEHFQNARYASALESLPDEDAARRSILADYILLYRGKSNLMMELGKEALRNFRLLQIAYPNSPLLREAILGECQSLLKINEPRTALEILSAPGLDTNLETIFYQARALDLSGEKARAIERYLQVYSRDVSSKFSPLAVRYLLALSPGALSGSRNYGSRLQRAENLLKDGDTRGARTLLLALGRAPAPDPQSSEKRNLLFGEAEYRLIKTTSALAYLRKITASDPEFHAKALYLEGSCYRRLANEQMFLSMRDKALKLYPRSSFTEELCYSAATYYDVNYDPPNAAKAYRVLYDSFPGGRYAERAFWKLALSEYLEKRYRDAVLQFWNYLLAYPSVSSAGQAMYWMGRCYEKLGDAGRARYLYGRVQALANDSYYGQRAREADASLKKTSETETAAVPGIDFNRVIQTCDGIQLPPVSMAEPEETVVPVMDRARELVAAGLSDLALNELRWGSRRNPRSDDALFYLMARIYDAREDHNEAIACLRRAFPDYGFRPADSLPREVWEVLFPMHHWETVSAQAARKGLDPALVLGLIRQESGFEEKARSKANARGLMQILPSTGRKLARQAQLPRYNAQKLFQANANIILGTQFLASLMRQYGREELALAAYNAGDTRADRWLKEFGTEDMTELVEQIPFSETRNYVKQVLTNKAHYSLQISSATR